MVHPNLNGNGDPEVKKDKTKADEFKEIKLRTEKHGYDSNLN